jgi:F-box/leucine-rich repeat protein 10/11
VVQQLDWIETAWPSDARTYVSTSYRTQRGGRLIDIWQERKGKQVKVTFPKVQYYCLSSTQGCYTDFHIDFGGSSVWYHVLQGQKVFWLIAPTDVNLKQYEKWSNSPEQ